MKVVIDTSVAIKWLVPEEDAHLAIPLRSPKLVRLAPDFLLIEVLNVLWKKARQSQIPTDVLREIAAGIDRLPLQVRTADLLRKQALEIAVALNITVYDALFVALADSEDATLVTADLRLLRRISESNLKTRISSLQDFVLP